MRLLALNSSVVVMALAFAASSACGGSVSDSGAGGGVSAPGAGGDGAAGKQYVAVGDEGATWSSPDGVRWTAGVSGTDKRLAAVATGRSVFVAVGARGTVVTSADGSTWTARTSGTTTDLSDVTFTGDRFVAVGGSWETGAASIASADGVSWTALEAPANYMFAAVTHGADGTLVVAANYRSDLMTPKVFRSTNGGTWTLGDGPRFYDGLTTNDGIAVVGERSFSTSRDGVVWNDHALPGTRLVTGVAFSGTSFVVVGERGAVYSSASGVDWTEQRGVPTEAHLTAVAHGGAGFVVVGYDGVVLTSADARTWAVGALGSKRAIADVVYGPTP